MYTHLSRALFQSMISELAVDIVNTNLFGLAVIAFWKRALPMHIYTCVYSMCIKKLDTKLCLESNGRKCKPVYIMTL